MKITSLLENTTKLPNISVEHGLSLYIETKSKNILFDMGQTELFCKNALELGIDLRNVDIAILSHGHYDHGGGLSAFLEINKKAPVYINRDAFLPHYNGLEKYIGLDTSLRDDPRIIFTDDEYKIDEGLTLFTCNDKKREHPPIPSGLNEKTNEGFIPDDFRHEQYLLIEENEKRFLISGCSHKGILDISKWIPCDFIIGGFHYSKLPLDKTLQGYAEALGALPCSYYTCHCTGIAQYEYMKSFMQRLHYLSCGETITI